MAKEKGLFVVFEGIDFSGKSTQAKRLASKLKEQGFDVVSTWEPGGTRAGSLIKEAIMDFSNGELAPKTELMLFAADREQHLKEVILPALEKGQVVICDRYTWSTCAYQLARGNTLKDVMFLTKVPVLPDLTIFLDIDYKTKRERQKAIGRNSNRFDKEKKEFFEAVRKNYKRLAKNASKQTPDRFLQIDTKNFNEEEVANLIYNWFFKMAKK